MKASKAKTLAVVAIVLFGLCQAITGALSVVGFSGENLGFDLRLRRNEIRCAHQGVNSFHIWTCETTLSGFAPHPRPDKESVVRQAGDGTVHAYPPWHTAFFWFYGWLSELLCVSLMSVVFGLCLAFIVCETLRISRERFGDSGWLYAGLALVLCTYAVVQCFFLLNYGVLILAAFLLMNRALEKGHGVLAGLAWAVMMIKPQVGLLFVWPLFWHRRFLTIMTAATVCLAATVFTSFAVHEPMIDLILQVPQIGAPYGSGVVTDKFVRPLLGDGATFVFPGLCFVLMGIATYLLRTKRDFLVSCLPAVFAIPFWTYSQSHDRVILLPAFLMLTGWVWTARRWNAWTTLGCLYLALQISMLGWDLAARLGVGRGWIYHLSEYGLCAAMLVIVVLFVRNTWRTAPSPRVHPVNPV